MISRAVNVLFSFRFGFPESRTGSHCMRKLQGVFPPRLAVTWVRLACVEIARCMWLFPLLVMPDHLARAEVAHGTIEALEPDSDSDSM